MYKCDIGIPQLLAGNGPLFFIPGPEDLIPGFRGQFLDHRFGSFFSASPPSLTELSLGYRGRGLPQDT